MNEYTITLIGRPADKVKQFYQELVFQFGFESFNVNVQHEVLWGHDCIRFIKTVGRNWTAVQKKKIRKQLSACIAQFIIRHEEEGLLRRMMVKDYAYHTESEQVQLLRYCCSIPDFNYMPEIERKTETTRRERVMTKEIERYLEEQNVINVDGLLEFRLKAYREELREMVDYAVDEYVMDKQYQEFIALLKYFVWMQQAKVDAAHLIHRKGNEFVLLNAEMEPIDPIKPESGFTMETPEKEFHYEDMVVSTLISVAPRNIYIHTRDPEMQIIKTISQIFDERAKLCESCAHCDPYHDKMRIYDPVSP